MKTVRHGRIFWMRHSRWYSAMFLAGAAVSAFSGFHIATFLLILLSLAFLSVYVSADSSGVTVRNVWKRKRLGWAQVAGVRVLESEEDGSFYLTIRSVDGAEFKSWLIGEGESNPKERKYCEEVARELESVRPGVIE